MIPVEDGTTLLFCVVFSGNVRARREISNIKTDTLTLNDYLIDYRVGPVHVIHVTRVVIAVGSLERSDCHVSVFRYLQAAVPRLNGP